MKISMQKAALVETQHQQQCQPIKLPHQKALQSSFRESFIASGKQGGRAMVLGEGMTL
jgi:hypothetical protein